MPQFLRTASVRLLESSQEALHLALTGLGVPVRHELRSGAARYAVPTGLIGVAAEQAMAAILVQVQGEEALMTSPGNYKSAREVLEDVRALLRAPVPRVSFLTVGVPDATQHRLKLLRATEGFVLLVRERAAGLHAGQGPSRGVVLSLAQKVLSLFGLLLLSSRVRPYLENVPRLADDVPTSDVMVDELARRFREAESLGERSEALRSLFLVLPEVPELAPEWLAAFDRSAVTPTSDDVSLLLHTLEQAEPVRFHRLNAAGHGFGVAVRPTDPNALPIAAHHLRKAFDDLLGQFDAYVGSANGRLKDGYVEPPPESVLLDMFVLGPARIREALARSELTPHSAWPFVVTALSVQGTPRPFWFLVSMVPDKGQLISLLRQALGYVSKNHLRRHIEEAIDSLAMLRKNACLDTGHSLAAFARLSFNEAEEKKHAIASAVVRSRGTNREASPDAESKLSQVADGALRPGEAFDAVMALTKAEAKIYWARLLAESTTDWEDRDMLVQIQRNQNVRPAHSAARKAMRLIDTVTFGPQIDLE